MFLRPRQTPDNFLLSESFNHVLCPVSGSFGDIQGHGQQIRRQENRGGSIVWIYMITIFGNMYIEGVLYMEY